MFRYLNFELNEYKFYLEYVQKFTNMIIIFLGFLMVTIIVNHLYHIFSDDPKQ